MFPGGPDLPFNPDRFRSRFQDHVELNYADLVHPLAPAESPRHRVGSGQSKTIFFSSYGKSRPYKMGSDIAQTCSVDPLTAQIRIFFAGSRLWS
jgi:hypothetical protein